MKTIIYLINSKQKSEEIAKKGKSMQKMAVSRLIQENYYHYGLSHDMNLTLHTCNILYVSCVIKNA